jgi:nucleoside-diphosphate-sugar epimerase
MLADAGHEPVLQDIQPLQTPYECMQGDARRLEDMKKAAKHAEVIVHTAAIHGIHLRDHTPQDFYDLNLTGTFNMWEAALQVGVRAVVFSSTMGVYKSHDAPHAGSGIALHEDLPLRPGDIYGFTKVAGEEMCRYYGRKHGIPSVALRYGMFVPEPFFRYGIRLLYGGVDTEDVARSVLVSIEALTSGTLQWDAFNIESHVPFTEEDGPQLRQDPLAVLERYYPGSSQLLRERGVEALAPIQTYYPMERIAERLGFRPACNFAQWLEDLRARPEERAEKSPPWP